MRFGNWQLVAVMGLACLLTSGCESMIDGICDNLTHDSDVRNYEHDGLSRKEAERRVYDDNFFAHMDDP